MSEETKTNEPVKQEGEFKIKKKTPKKLTPVSDEPIRLILKNLWLIYHQKLQK